jgi:hypothetical protein
VQAPQSQISLWYLQAADGGRTRDLKLGKLALYQLSYRRAGAILRRMRRSRRSCEKTLHLEVARVHYERAQASDDPAGYGLDTVLVATEQLTGGQARSQLETLGLPAELNARIRRAIEQRNAVLHRPLEDADLARAIGTGEGIEKAVKRIERIALDCGELSVELERFAGDRLAAMLGISREQMAQVVAALDPATIPDHRMRAQVEAIKASGIDLSHHPYPAVK